MWKYILFISLFVSTISNCQSDEADGTVNVNLPAYGASQNINGTLIGASSSGAPSCGLSADDDVFYSFTATTQGAQFVFNSPSFDGVIEVWDNALVSINCEDAIVGFGTEELWLTNLIPGDLYHLRIHSATGVSGAGDFTIDYQDLPERVLQGVYRNTNLNGDYYRPYDYLRRTVGLEVESTNWKFRNLFNNTTYVYEVVGNSFQTNLINVEQEAGTIANPFFCYGDSLEVSIEVVLEGSGCGFGAPYKIYFQEQPNTVLLTSFVGSFLNPSIDYLSSVNTHLDQVMEWEFSEFGNFLEMIATPLGENRVFLNTSTQLVYNRAYNVRIRVTSCGEVGPWSDYQQFFTTDIPYVQINPISCNSTISNGSVIDCNTIPLATSYIWQAAPISLNDPSFTPIGPAILFETTNSAVILSGLEPNTAYRIAVKTSFANGAQVAEYGNFCQIGTAGSGVGMLLDDNLDESTNIQLSTLNDKITLYPNPVTKGTLFINILDKDTDYSLLIYNSYGELNYKDVLRESSSIDLSSFQKGTYIVKVVSENSIFHERILIR